MVSRAVIARRFRPADAGALYALAPPGDGPLVARAIARAQSGEQAILVAEADGALIGQIWIDLVRRREEEVAVAYAFRVARPFRRRGIGSALLVAAERLAAALGFRRLEVGVTGESARLFRMYQTRGYRRVGRRVDCERWRDQAGERAATFDQAIFEKELELDERTQAGHSLDDR